MSAHSAVADDRRVVVGACAAISIGTLTANVLPMMLGALVDARGFDEGSVGWLGTLELGCMAGSAIAVAPLLGRLSLRRLVVAASVVVLAVQLLCIGVSGFEALLALRVAAGAASGVVYASANASIARTANPERSYAVLMIALALIAAVILGILPVPIERWGVAGLFASLSGVTLLFLPFLVWLPEGQREGTVSTPPGASVAILLLGTSLCVIAANFFVAVGSGGLWAFTERIALTTGLDREGIGLVLGATTIIAIVGAGAAAWLGTRWGRTLPAISSIAALGALGLWITLTRSPGEYAAAQFAYSTIYVFAAPYFLGVAAALDPVGRLPAAVSGATLVGGATGPVLAGQMVSGEGFALLGVGVLVVSLVGYTARRARSDRRIWRRFKDERAERDRSGTRGDTVRDLRACAA